MGPVAGAVALHFDVATPNFVIQEEAVGLVPWFDEIFDTPCGWKMAAGPSPTAPASASRSTRPQPPAIPSSPRSIPALEAVLPDGTIANW